MMAMIPVLVRGAFGYDVDAVSEETGLTCLDETYTTQSESEEADINTLVKRFGLTGVMPQRVDVPIQEDFVEARSFHESLNIMLEAEAAFMEFPAEIRARFNHDAGKLVEFVSDPANRKEAEELGIVVRPEVDPAPAAGAPAAAVVAPAA